MTRKITAASPSPQPLWKCAAWISLNKFPAVILFVEFSNGPGNVCCQLIRIEKYALSTNTTEERELGESENNHG